MTSELRTQLEGKKKLEVAATIYAESTLHNPDSVDRSAESRINLAASYPLSDKIRSALSVSAIQGLDTAQKTYLSNAKLSFSHSAIRLTQDTSLLAGAGLRLPTNVEDRKLKSYNGAAYIAPQLLTNWSPSGFTFTTLYRVEAQKNSHYWDRTASGAANLSYSVVNYLGVEHYLTEHISILVDGDYTYARTYQNSLRTNFSVGESITYEAPKWSLTLGHSNGADALLANGQDYNIKAFDEKTSAVYINTRIVF